jgi:hypothetical protein
VEFGGDDDDDSEDVIMLKWSFEENNKEVDRKPEADMDNDTTPAEGKKSEEPQLSGPSKPGRLKQNQRYSSTTSLLLMDDEGPVSVAAAGYDNSVASSGTTVMRTNITSQQ